jgi:putative endonuclease
MLTEPSGITLPFAIEHRRPALSAPTLHRAVSMTLHRQELGKTGEDLAVDELERLGYAIVARRYRTKHGEIDIVAMDGETTVFVEVKTRETIEFGSAAEAVTPAKQRRLVSMATDYLMRHRLMNTPCRFDVIAIDPAPGQPGRKVLTLFRNAFDA